MGNPFAANNFASATIALQPHNGTTFWEWTLRKVNVEEIAALPDALLRDAFNGND
jgi:hypothetical protein